MVSKILKLYYQVCKKAMHGQDLLLGRIGKGKNMKKIINLIQPISDKLWNTRFKGCDPVLTKSTLKVDRSDELSTKFKGDIKA